MFLSCNCRLCTDCKNYHALVTLVRSITSPELDVGIADLLERGHCLTITLTLLTFLAVAVPYTSPQNHAVNSNGILQKSSLDVGAIIDEHLSLGSWAFQ
jgi:hypothetical protein